MSTDAEIFKKQLNDKHVIHWLRRDQRFQDHLVFSNVESLASLTVFYLYDQKYDEKHFLEFDLISDKRKRFLDESLIEIEKKLNSQGVKLFRFSTKDELSTATLQADIVTYQKLYGTEEIQEEKRVLALFDEDKLPIYDFTLVDKINLPFTLEKLPQVFTSFRKKVEKVNCFQNPISDINLPEKSTAYKLQGGESHALQRIRYYFFESKRLAQYKETRNGMVGTDYSSRLSPWLANGNVSARSVFKLIEEFESIHGSNSSTYWLKFELLWRDFFQFQLQLHGSLFFKAGGVQQKEKKFLKNINTFWKWATGETGDELVDANMRELNSTGWMSNRGRQNVASYLIHDMGIHWRWGAAYLESQLVDYDPASNWGNWMYIAGVGHDPRPFRKFNTVGQAERYDPDRTYRDLWLK